VETIVILVVAAGISAAVVWWATMPPGASILPRRGPTRRETREASLNFREAFQSTGPDPATLRPTPVEDGFMTVEQAVPDERPPPVLSVIRLVFAIGLVAALGVAVIAILWLLVRLQLDRFLGGG
jgi:hypothetical protein